MLLQLLAHPEVPEANCVVKTTGVQLVAIWGNVNAAGTISMTLKLPVSAYDLIVVDIEITKRTMTETLQYIT